MPSTAFMGDVDATILGITPPRIRRDLGAARSPAGHALAFSPLGAVLSVGNAGAPPLGRPLPAPPTTAS
ncbi:hypothetical protein ACSDR0_04640 [Streptosporangium sp. G11]|uniref:hypothetical protein n=1 Tax=Streptosporangium sp. G11 TaxID=3436926 RepID=UPI003EB6A9BB